MTNSIEDRLRAALHAAPPVDARPVPLEEIKRGAGRRQALAAAAATAAVAVIATAVTYALPAGGGAPDRTQVYKSPTPSPTGAAAQLWRNPAHGLATSPDGLVWTATDNVGPTGTRWYVIGQGPSGVVQQRIAVPGPVDSLTYGAGELWALGSNQAGASNGRVTAIDPGTNQVASRVYRQGVFLGLAFIDGDPYISSFPNDRVTRLAVHNNRIDYRGGVRMHATPGPLAAFGAHSLWTRAGDKLVEITVHGHSLHVGANFPWGGSVLAVSHRPESIWTSDARDRLSQIDPAIMATSSVSAGYVGDRLQLNDQPVAVFEDANGGLFVAVEGGVDYFNARARHDAHAQPTAFVPTDWEVASMTADPSGGVVFSTGAYDEFYWDPTGG